MTIARRNLLLASALAVLGIVSKPRRQPTHDVTNEWTFAGTTWKQKRCGNRK